MESSHDQPLPPGVQPMSSSGSTASYPAQPHSGYLEGSVRPYYQPYYAAVTQTDPHSNPHFHYSDYNQQYTNGFPLGHNGFYSYSHPHPPSQIPDDFQSSNASETSVMQSVEQQSFNVNSAGYSLSDGQGRESSGNTQPVEDQRLSENNGPTTFNPSASSDSKHGTVAHPEQSSSVTDEHHNSTPKLVQNYSRLQPNNDQDIETAAQKVVLQEQEIATQKIIEGQRHLHVGSGPSEDHGDFLAGRHNPSALKEHLLKMATDHRAEMASKRGKPTVAEGGLEIGNGYGVPGGGAYSGALGPGSKTMEQTSAGKDLPEYLKQKLKARGILKEHTSVGETAGHVNVLETHSTVPTSIKLPSGWVEAKDPATGAPYYYNQQTGATQWDLPSETYFGSESYMALSSSEEWVETLDDTSGRMYYYNKRTHVSQWKVPEPLRKKAKQSGVNLIKRVPNV